MTQWSSGPQPGPAGPYGRPGYQPGPPYAEKPPRETGAQVVCIALLVLALIGGFIASAAVHGRLTNDSASAPAVPGSYSAGGAAAGGGGSSSARSAGSIDFPVYPGARKVASAKPYLKPYSVYYKNATNYVTHASVATVFRWYQAHLAAHHLKLYQPDVYRDPKHTIYQVNAPINSPDAVAGDLNLEAGIRGYTIVMVQLYG